MNEELLRIIELFDEDEVTTADKIDRPERALEKEAIDNFMKRNPMAGGGMLVQPGFGGTRQGYAGRTAKKITDYPPEVQQRIKDYGIQKYNKLNKNQKYDIRNPKRLNKTFNFKFKGNKFPTQVLGLKEASAKNIQDLLNIIEKNPNITPEQWFAKTSKVKGASSGLDQLSRDLLKYIKGDFDAIKGATSKETFDKLNIKNLIKDEIPNLNTISGKVFRQSVGTAARAKKAVTNTFEAVMRLNEEFKLDPDVDIEELAEQLYGKGASRSVPLINQTRNDVARYVEVLKTGSRRNLNIPNFKYPSPDKAADILDSIADRSGSFGFQEGVIRDLKFSIRDDLLKLEKGTTTNLRRVLSDLIKGKGDVIDEAVGLSATFEDAPGYTEATQVIKGKINKRKANTIDKPFSALIKKLKTNSATTKEINDFNTISKRFMKEEGVDSPIIKTGKNLKPEKFIKSFKDYSPEAQANIKQLAKENNFVIQTKSEPLKNVVSSLQKRKGERGSIDRQFLTDAGKFLGRTAQAGFLTPTGVAATTLGLGGLDLTSPVGRLSLGAELAAAPELVKASIGATRGMKNRALQKGIQQALNLGLPTRLALRAARVASPIGIATLAGEGLYQAGKFTKKRIGELQAMTPEQRQQLRAEQSALAFEGARDGGLIGKKSGPPPISGPTPHGDEGLPGIFKRAKKG